MRQRPGALAQARPGNQQGVVRQQVHATGPTERFRTVARTIFGGDLDVEEAILS